MLKRIAAIALNLLLLSSPARSLMADDAEGFSEDSKVFESEITFVILIDAAFADENCYGWGSYTPYRPDMAVTIWTTDEKVYHSVHPQMVKKEVFNNRLRCAYFALVKIPSGKPFYLSLAGVAIPGQLYDIVESDRGNGFYSVVSNINLIDLMRLQRD